MSHEKDKGLIVMKMLVVSENQKLLDDIAVLSAARTTPVPMIAMRGGLLDANLRMATEVPQLVVLDVSSARLKEMEVLERFSAQYPRAVFMLLTPEQSPDLLIRAMRAGVREVVPLPLDASTFNDALSRAEQKILVPANRNGKVLSFISCKGGSGATFIAANLGYGLAAVAQKKVLLIDLNQQFGDAALYVSDKKPAATLPDICAQLNRLDPAFLESSLVSAAPNFGILAASDDPARAADVKAEHIDAILRLARNYYDFILLDLGRQIDAVTIRALDHSDTIYPVLQLALPYIRDGRRLLDIFRSLDYRRDKISLIVNRYDKKGKLTLADLEGALRSTIAHAIPNDYEAVVDSVNQGIPVIKLARSSQVAKKLSAFAVQLDDRPASTASGFIGRIFGRSPQLAT